jgi:uncharacterized protein with GYD domain
MKAWEAPGGKVLGFYAMTGESDYLAIGEGPHDEAAVQLALTLGLGGNVRTAAARASTVDEFAEIVEKLR